MRSNLSYRYVTIQVLPLILAVGLLITNIQKLQATESDLFESLYALQILHAANSTHKLDNMPSGVRKRLVQCIVKYDMSKLEENEKQALNDYSSRLILKKTTEAEAEHEPLSIVFDKLEKIPVPVGENISLLSPYCSADIPTFKKYETK
jgi:hypothetical protein